MVILVIGLIKQAALGSKNPTGLPVGVVMRDERIRIYGIYITTKKQSDSKRMPAT